MVSSAFLLMTKNFCEQKQTGGVRVSICEELCVPETCGEIYQTWPVTWTLFGIYDHCQNARSVLTQPETDPPLRLHHIYILAI